MSKKQPTEIYSLRAVAAAEGISYAHMKKLMMDIVKSDPIIWRDWNFQAIGPESRKTWIAYRGKIGDVIVHNEPTPSQAGE